MWKGTKNADGGGAASDAHTNTKKYLTMTTFQAVTVGGVVIMLLSPRVSPTSLSVIPRTATLPDARKTREGGSLNRETKQNHLIIIKCLDQDIVSGGLRAEREDEWEGSLAPQACVVAVQAGTQRAACHEELGPWLVVAVGVHRVGEGMNVGKITPPRLIMIQPAFPCRELEDAVPGALPVAALEGQRVLQEPLGSDVVEEEGTLAGAHRHDVLVEAHRANTASPLSGADGLDGVGGLPRVQKGDVGLRAHRVNWPVLSIGQTHVLLAVRQLSR